MNPIHWRCSNVLLMQSVRTR